MSKRDNLIGAVESIVATLHREGDFDCDARLNDDALEDHSAEVAIAGSILAHLQSSGFTITKRRAPRHSGGVADLTRPGGLR